MVQMVVMTFGRHSPSGRLSVATKKSVGLFRSRLGPAADRLGIVFLNEVAAAADELVSVLRSTRLGVEPVGAWGLSRPAFEGAVKRALF